MSKNINNDLIKSFVDSKTGFIWYAVDIYCDGSSYNEMEEKLKGTQFHIAKKKEVLQLITGRAYDNKAVDIMGYTLSTIEEKEYYLFTACYDAGNNSIGYLVGSTQSGHFTPPKDFSDRSYDFKVPVNEVGWMVIRSIS